MIENLDKIARDFLTLDRDKLKYDAFWKEFKQKYLPRATDYDCDNCDCDSCDCNVCDCYG